MKALSLLPILLCLALPAYGESEAEGLFLVDRALAEAVTEDALEKREHEGGELFYLQGSQTPFTGWVKSLDPDGRIAELSQYEDGRQEGLQIGYWHELGILDLMWPSLTLAMTAGYDTHYIFRGETFGEDAVWSAIDMSAPLMDGMAVSGGAFYVSSAESIRKKRFP